MQKKAGKEATAYSVKYTGIGGTKTAAKLPAAVSLLAAWNLH